MDILKATTTYIDRMLTDVAGLKLLLLDGHTVGPGARRLVLSV